MATPSAARSIGAEVALSPAQRSAMIYALDEDHRDEVLEALGRARVADVDGVDLTLLATTEPGGGACGAPGRAAFRSRRGATGPARGELER